MGIVFIILASVLFGTTPSVESALLQAGMQPWFVAFMSTALSGGFALAAGVIRKESFRLSGRQLLMMILAGAIGRGITEICLVTAYTMIPAGVATMVHFFFPTIVCIVSVLLFHEKWGWHKLAAVVLSICGLMGIAGGVSSGDNILGVLAAGITSFSFAFYYLMTERSCIRDVDPMPMVCYIHLFSAAEIAVGVTVNRQWTPIHEPRCILLFLAAGLICFLGFVFLNKGIALVGADIAAFINMLEPVTSLTLSLILYHSRISAGTIVGSALILSAMLVTAIAGRKKSVSAN